MVTGRTPLQSGYAHGDRIKLVNDPLPRPRQFVPGLPAQTEQVIFKSLAKKPAEDRYLDMGAFAAALENWPLPYRPQNAAAPSRLQPYLPNRRK